MTRQHMNQRLFQHLSELFILVIFAFSIVYVLDDVIQVLSLKGFLSELAFNLFFAGPLFAFFLSLFWLRKAGVKRFKIYIGLSIIQLLMIVMFIFIVMNSQV